MRLVVTGGNVSVIGRAIHALSRIGEDCYLEALDEGLAVRTVNSSRSAFASFLFAPAFFQKYDPGNPTSEADGSPSQTENFRCKIVMKSVLAVFKSPATLEKTVEKCKMALGRGMDQLIIQLLCKYGITKTHNLAIQDSETLQAVYDKELCPNTLRVQPKLLTDTVVHFPANLEEVTLEVKGGRVYFRNYIEPETDPRKTMHTEMVLTSMEFDEFSVTDETEITFCLKELRGLLGFAEVSGLPVTVHFQGPGSPAIFSLQEAVLQGNFVLATLAGVESQSTGRAGGDGSSGAGAHRVADDFMNEEMDSYMIAMETSALEQTVSGSAAASDQSAPPRSPTFPLAQSNKRVHTQHRGALSPPHEEDEPDDTEIPATPPHKKFRSLFFGSLLSPGRSLRPTLGHEVLAEASESDSET
ncbi:cell cycle checkpoint control protein RAD9A-like isoform X2 [Hemiscyllium ocellatum]|uniref:cell cycle checkpoint control protein RAD9A-like isoform X2 n=1 Tax=Hemiscyllium ocellatum TaxID=170820 RepID=UPI002965D342|nr:cell cycle checkpoint control protein RAD9A-like isoform X2 [Hemiscyllium ocellatum]XP_060679521.1 cell cycle checkpoint control protein RAD9A-like isoform X2 [Hemiscyllium ocellatum]